MHTDRIHTQEYLHEEQLHVSLVPKQRQSVIKPYAYHSTICLRLELIHELSQLPACSRCVSKGIKCDPRSTRRTSDNNYQTSMKRPFVSSKRHHFSNTTTTLTGRVPARGLSSTKRSQNMRATSHIDFRTAVKMSQHAAAVSGFPVLTPLPTYASHIKDECYSYSSSPEQNLGGFIAPLDNSNFPSPSQFTPDTPKQTIYHEPLSVGESIDLYLNSQPWSDDPLAPYTIGFESHFTAVPPTDLWPMSEPDNIMPLAHSSWPYELFSAAPTHVSTELSLHTEMVPTLSTGQYSPGDFNASAIGQQEWSIHQLNTSQNTMTSISALAPFTHDLQPVLSNTSMCQDCFGPGPSPY